MIISETMWLQIPGDFGQIFLQKTTSESRCSKTVFYEMLQLEGQQFTTQRELPKWWLEGNILIKARTTPM